MFYTTSVLENNQASLWADAIFSRVYKDGLSIGGRLASLAEGGGVPWWHLVNMAPANGASDPLGGRRRDCVLASMNMVLLTEGVIRLAEGGRFRAGGR